MKITSSYKVEILHLHEPLKKTMAVSRAASAWLEPVIDGAWDRLSLLTREKERLNTAEQLIHNTKKNTAAYAFDAVFPKSLYAGILQGQYVPERGRSCLSEAV